MVTWGPPQWTECLLSDSCENITFPQLRLRVVIIDCMLVPEMELRARTNHILHQIRLQLCCIFTCSNADHAGYDAQVTRF